MAKTKIDLPENVDFTTELTVRITDAESGKEVARARTGQVCFDYGARKVQKLPDAFKALCGV